MRIRTPLVFSISLLLLAVSVPEASAGRHLFGKAIRGSGEVRTRELDLDGFDRIQLDGAFDLEIRLAREFSVRLTTDDNLFDEMEIEVRDRTLVVDCEDDLRPSDGNRIEITLPELAAVDINGAGDVRIEGYEGDSLEIDISGAGDLTLDGEVGDLKISIAGAGDVEAGDLIARRAVIRIAGAGDAEIHATESLDAVIMGVGDVTYRGDPERKRTRVSGIGEIRAR